MAKTFHPKVLTANDLIGGHSVFLTAEGWRPLIHDALVALTPEQATDLEQTAEPGVQQNEVIGPYLIDVSLHQTAPEPILRRERIRVAGRPSIAFEALAHLDHAA